MVVFLLARWIEAGRCGAGLVGAALVGPSRSAAAAMTAGVAATSTAPDTRRIASDGTVLR
jgi:hypothetical protein